MAKQARGAKKQDKFGTGKVTPMQIAFMVDRYLSDNNYSATLSSFRSEASDLLSRTHGKKVPKGLMGLADILNDYIHIKEQKLIVDHEKQRVEAAMKGINDVIQVYYSETLQSASMPATTSPQQIVASPTVPLFCGSNIGNPSPSNYAMHTPSISNSSKPPLLPPKTGDSLGFSTPTNTLHSAEKRKSSKSTTKEPPSPKKLRSQPSSTSNNVMQGVRSSEEGCGSNSRGKQLVQAAAPAPSLVVKKLFSHPPGGPPHPNNTSSPKTPPQALDSQTDKSLSPLENSSSINAAPDTACSMISSSQTIIISPLKQKGYYAVERSYQLTACSPIKAGAATKLGRRDHVKGRLDFDRVEAPAELAPEKEQQQQSSCAADSSGGSPSDDAETPPELDFDIPDFDIFDGDFLSGLLADIGDQNGGAFSICHSDNNCFLATVGPGDMQQSSASAAASSEGLGLQDYSANIRF